MVFSRQWSIRALVLLGTGIFVSSCSDAVPTGPEGLSPAGPAHDHSTSASLIVCPSGEDYRAEGVIGPEGGTVSVAGHSITLPEGAVASPTEIRVRARESKYLVVEITAEDLPDNRFLAPATVTLSYARCKDSFPTPQFSAWHIDSATSALLENMGGVLDTAAYTVNFQTGHLSVFAIAN